jgi:hypothetical protein
MDMAGNFVESRFAIDRRTISGVAPRTDSSQSTRSELGAAPRTCEAMACGDIRRQSSAELVAIAYCDTTPNLGHVPVSQCPNDDASNLKDFPSSRGEDAAN